MRDNQSPEEKLLRLIKGQKKIPPLAAQKKPAAQESPVSKSPKNILNFNRQKIIALAFIIGGIYLAWSFAYPFRALKESGLPKVSAKEAGKLDLDLEAGKKPIEFYQQEFSGRQIFSGVKEGGAGAPASGVNVDLTKDINLVGIISGEPAQAVIEDVKTKKTYYVTRGQFIGEFQVDDIQEGKIIINYNGQKYELYM